MRLVSAALAVVLAIPATARAEPGARERTESLIAAFKAVPADSGKLTAAQRQARERQFAVLDGFFDYDELTTRPVAPRAARLSAAQLKQFKTRFRGLIRAIAYADSGDFFRRAKVKLHEAEAAGNASTVRADVKVPEEDLETVIEFHWRQGADGSLRVVDVSFEGDSLVRDYQNQISRIVDRSGPEGLLAALDARWAELQKTAAK